MSKNVFSQLFHSPLAEISNLALSAVLTFFRSDFRWLVEVWVRSEHFYRPLIICAWESLTELCLIEVQPLNLHMRLWFTEFVSPQAQRVDMPFTFHPYLMQTASVNSCLFSTYPIALIGKVDSQEDAPFSIAPFIRCCDSGVIPAKSSSRMFLHFSFFSCRILYFVCLVNCWSEGL